MEFVDLQQNTEEWLEHRRYRRNASEAGAVIGVDPYMTRYQLWQQKQGIEIHSEYVRNVIMAHGNNMEPLALKAAEKYLSVKLAPCVAVDGEYSASLDGYGVDENGDTYKVEIKCPQSGEASSIWKSAKNNEVSEQYQWQMTHQDLVIPTTRTIFFVFLEPGVQKAIEFKPKSSDKKRLVREWDDFYANPPNPDFVEVEDESIILMMADHKKVSEKIKVLTEEKKSMAKAIEAGTKQNSTCRGAKITFFEKKGSVDYSKIPELKGVDLEKYRKSSRKEMKITHQKEES